MSEYFFWSCAAFIVYAYLGYPILVYAISRLRPRPIQAAAVTPRVSLIITARNEEGRIGAKLENTLALDYPRECLEIIVASDCSSDSTHAIVQGHESRGVRLVVSPERRGKEFAQQCAIAASSMDILVFSDVATQLAPSGLRCIVQCFADASVGCVSSEDRVIGPDGHVSGEGAYVRYEMWLRALETRLGSVVGLSGSFFAARREVCQGWKTDLPSDFTTLLNSLKLGLRGVSDPTAIGYYPDLSDQRREYSRKVRTIVRGMSALLRHLELLNPFRFGLAAWQLFSHKLCRWLVPFALAGLLISNAALFMDSKVYAALGIAQVLAVGIALLGPPKGDRGSGIRRIVSFFMLANVSILHAWYLLLRGRRFTTWEPSRRNSLVRS